MSEVEKGRELDNPVLKIAECWFRQFLDCRRQASTAPERVIPEGDQQPVRSNTVLEAN